MKYQIRDCEPRDLGPLIVLCEHHATFERSGYCRANKIDNLREAIFSDPRMLWCSVVESDGLLVGYCTYTFDYSTWDASIFMNMDCLYLDPAFRGVGIGSKIMEELRQVAVAKKCASIQWQTPTFNEEAIKFYERIGAVGNEKMRFTWPLNGCDHLPKE